MKRSLLKEVPRDLPDELIEVLSCSESIRIERIISLGHRSPDGAWYDQEANEFVLLVRGRAGLSIEGEDDTVVLEEGDYVILRAHVRHRVEWTDSERETIWLAVHY